MPEPKGNILPIYFVADESGSMSDDIDELNAGLKSLLDEIHGEPMAGRKVRFSVIGFGSDAVPRLPMTDLLNHTSIPTLEIHGTTSYSNAFNKLKECIEKDVNDLEAQNYKVNRPAVFFLTDGFPDDEPWKQAYDQLVDPQFRAHPNIIAFGIGAAKAEVVVEVATKPEYAFISEPAADMGKALSNFVKALTNSIVQTAQGSGDLIVDKPEGFLRIAQEVI